MNFDLENTRRQLIAKRIQYGAESAIGHRCSNIIEMLQAYGTAMPERKTALAKSIARQTLELERLIDPQ